MEEEREKGVQPPSRVIRLLTGCELEDALALVWDVFSTFESESLDQEAIDEFWAQIDYEYMLSRAGDGEIRFWGAFEDDFLVGVCAMRQLSHLELLYVDGEYHKQGVATNLLKHAMIDCKELDDSLSRVTVNATPFSRGFFVRLGFHPTGEEQCLNGLKFTPMVLEGTSNA